MATEKEEGGVRSHINVTPLVDVLLVLLIIFMVITPLTRAGFTARLPERAVRGGPSDALVLQIEPSGLLRLNRHAIAEKDLGPELAGIYATRADKTLFLDVDDRTPYSTLVRVLDTCRSPGRAEVIGFVMR